MDTVQYIRTVHPYSTSVQYIRTVHPYSTSVQYIRDGLESFLEWIE
jgi:hypothetical protein